MTQQIIPNDVRSETLRRLMARRAMRIARLGGRRGARGVTLIEILVVITILTGLTAVLAVNVFDNLKRAKLGQAQLEVGKIAGQAQLWIEEPTNNGCPTVAQLITDKQLPSQQNTADPWGTPYVITCPAGEQAVVSSAGPDRKTGSPDDIASNKRPTKAGTGTLRTTCATVSHAVTSAA